MREKKARRRDACEGGDGKAPERQHREPCGIADDVERQERQQPAHEDDRHQRILRSDQANGKAAAEPAVNGCMADEPGHGERGQRAGLSAQQHVESAPAMSIGGAGSQRDRRAGYWTDQYRQHHQRDDRGRAPGAHLRHARLQCVGIEDRRQRPGLAQQPVQAGEQGDQQGACGQLRPSVHVPFGGTARASSGSGRQLASVTLASVHHYNRGRWPASARVRETCGSPPAAAFTRRTSPRPPPRRPRRRSRSSP